MNRQTLEAVRQLARCGATDAEIMEAMGIGAGKLAECAGAIRQERARRTVAIKERLAQCAMTKGDAKGLESPSGDEDEGEAQEEENEDVPNFEKYPEIGYRDDHPWVWNEAIHEKNADDWAEHFCKTVHSWNCKYPGRQICQGFVDAWCDLIGCGPDSFLREGYRPPLDAPVVKVKGADRARVEEV